jgi:hypothetical protein
MLRDPGLAVRQPFVQMAHADRATRGDQRQELEADRICQRSIDLQGEVPRLVNDARRRQILRSYDWQGATNDGLGLGHGRSLIRDRDGVQKLKMTVTEYTLAANSDQEAVETFAVVLARAGFLRDPTRTPVRRPTEGSAYEHRT